ncbi:unnamed protein product [Cuscuta epithymum]|uniref:Peptidase A1 domain-containing protein n=1 Tax=Cuscuta epithymum TaxID=186058 RepID=A0AAV0EEC6_9ASTE|nr:unnamed protein product [Cuscuta epithymum]
MAYIFRLLALYTTLITFMAGLSLAQRPFFPRAIILPVTKDLPTSQYVTQIQIGHSNNFDPLKLVVDLGGPFLWADSASSSQGSIPCGSLKCSMANPSGGCTSKEICGLLFENPISKMAGSGILKEDSIALEFIADEPKASSFLSYVPDFLFSSVPSLFLQGLGSGVNGVLGLGNSRVSLTSQLANAYGGIPRKFSLCLSSSNGAIISGDILQHNDDVSRSMVYTPLVSGQNGLEYYINVKSIKINDKRLDLNGSLLFLDEEGVGGGTKISTVVPYTTMKTKIYNEFLESFLEAAAASKLTRVHSVGPFEVCFKDVVGWDAPKVEFVLQSEMVKWRIMNAMVKMSSDDGVMCLGILDGGQAQIASIVIGGYQLEDNLLDFNLGTSMLGFTPLMPETTCSHFSGLFRDDRGSV